MKIRRMRKFVLVHKFSGQACLNALAYGSGAKTKHTTNKPKRARPGKCAFGSRLAWRRVDHVQVSA